MSLENEPNDTAEGVVAHDKEYPDQMQSQYANIRVALQSYDEVCELLDKGITGDEYGSQEEIRDAHTTLERTLHNVLEDIHEDDLVLGLENGDLTEKEATNAIRYKRKLELEQIRDSYANEATRNHDDDERER